MAMGQADDFLNAINVIVDKKLAETSTQVYSGRCVSVDSTAKCTVAMNGRNNSVQYYGQQPIVGNTYRVIVPMGNMSNAYIIVANSSPYIASATEPSDTGALWIDTSANQMKYYNGTSWVSC